MQKNRITHNIDEGGQNHPEKHAQMIAGKALLLHVRRQAKAAVVVDAVESFVCRINELHI
jgi:hypothetical protein